MTARDLSPGFLTPDRCWQRVVQAPHDGWRGPALFLDRDGVMIEERDYLADPDGVALIAGVEDTIRSARALGYFIAVVTNQSGIGRGRFTWDEYAAVEARLIDLLTPGNACPDAIFACPYHPDGIAPYNRDHNWRKPGAGMLLTAAETFGIDMAASLMVGDKISDLKAGHGAGVSTVIHVATGHGKHEREAALAYARTHSAVCVESIANVRQYLRPYVAQSGESA